MILYEVYNGQLVNMVILGEKIFQCPKCHSKCQNGTLKLSLEELAIINALKTNPALTQKQISELVGKSERTIKRCTVEMQEKGLIARENGKRNGKCMH